MGIYSTWGGSVIQDDRGIYHMYASVLQVLFFHTNLIRTERLRFERLAP